MSTDQEVQHDKLKQLLKYWESIGPESQLPARTDIDPIQIPSLLPNVMLVDVEREAVRFRFRLVGSAIVKFVGKDCKGTYVDEIRLSDEEDLDDILADYKSVLASTAPVCRQRNVKTPDNRRFLYERLLLPLASDGATIDCLLGGVCFEEQPIPVPSPRRRL